MSPAAAMSDATSTVRRRSAPFGESSGACGRRETLAHLAIDDAGLTLKAIANWMGATEWATSKMRLTLKALYTSDGNFRRIIDPILVALSWVSRCDPNLSRRRTARRRLPFE
jgi:hypothetical protein